MIVEVQPIRCRPIVAVLCRGREYFAWKDAVWLVECATGDGQVDWAVSLRKSQPAVVAGSPPIILLFGEAPN